jgi:hypothetical protein
MNQGVYLVKPGDSATAFELRPVVLPPLMEGQVLIRVAAFGLNFADVMARRGKYREAPSFPFPMVRSARCRSAIPRFESMHRTTRTIFGETTARGGCTTRCTLTTA